MTDAEYPERNRDSVTANIHIVEEIPGNRDKRVIGIAYHGGAVCNVYVRADVYPHAVMHEIMHCFSGNWHEGVDSSEYQHIVD